MIQIFGVLFVGEEAHCHTIEYFRFLYFMRVNRSVDRLRIAVS